MEKGIFGLGCPYTDEMALRWVLQHSLEGDGSDTGASTGNPRVGAVVVFGSGMDALAAVGGLIKNNVPPRLIFLVIAEAEMEELGHHSVSSHLIVHDLLISSVFWYHVIQLICYMSFYKPYFTISYPMM